MSEHDPVTHHTVHEKHRDEVERAFWRLNDYTHGYPSFHLRNEAWTWHCSCGAGASISNAPPGYGGRLLFHADATKTTPCPLMGEALTRGALLLTNEPDDVFDYEKDKKLIRARAVDVRQTLADFCERVAFMAREARKKA